MERIIYLDSDTLIFRDLSKMYNLNFNHNNILGPQAHDKYIMNKFNIKLKVLINVGVILFNIKKIRKYNKDIELVFNPNIGILPYSYGMRIIDSLKTYKKYCEPAYIIKYSINEIKNALLKPEIIHLVYCSPKIWNRLTKSRFKNDNICFKYQKQFYFYTKKTKYFFQKYIINYIEKLKKNC